MGIFENIEPKSVFHFFEEISSIPHGSGNTKSISDYCVRFAKKRGLKYYQDSLNNVIIWKNASPGINAAEPIIIQGHLDMVCDKEDHIEFDFFNEGIKLKVEDGYVTAEGTTLGGDDGSAIAIMLALLDSDITSPPIEAVFTVDEEIGMLGAAKLDMSLLKGKKMINLDGEDEREFIVSCAGGVRVNVNIPINRKEAEAVRCRIIIDGLKGGHSGMAPGKGLANSNELMGRVLRAAEDETDFRIISVCGGAKDNVVPAKTVAEIITDENNLSKLKIISEQMTRIFKNEFAASDPDITASLEIKNFGKAMAADQQSTGKIISALLLMPNGLQAMSMEIDGLVQTSLNLGILNTEIESLCFSTSVRSSKPSQKQFLVEKIKRLAYLLNGTVETHGDYPAWEYKIHSPFRDTLLELYKEEFGRDAEVRAIHAGLECGMFSDNIDGLDCVSFGPDVKDVHSPKEKMSISSVERIWKYLLKVLAVLAEK